MYLPRLLIVFSGIGRFSTIWRGKAFLKSFAMYCKLNIWVWSRLFTLWPTCGSFRCILRPLAKISFGQKSGVSRWVDFNMCHFLFWLFDLKPWCSAWWDCCWGESTPCDQARKCTCTPPCPIMRTILWYYDDHDDYHNHGRSSTCSYILPCPADHLCQVLKTRKFG